MAMHVHNREDGRVRVVVVGRGGVEEVSGIKQRPFFFFFLRGKRQMSPAFMPPDNRCYLAQYPGSPLLTYIEVANVLFCFFWAINISEDKKQTETTSW